MDSNPVIRAAVLEVPEVLPYLSDKAIILSAGKAGGDLSQINASYRDAITQSLVSFFEGGNAAASRNQFKRSAVEALGGAFDLGYGGTPESDALQWLNARVEQEMAFIDELYVNAKELRRDESFDYFTWITQRADGYVSSCQAVYNAGLMFASKNTMGTWNLGQTEEHCPTCNKLNGQRHKLSWYLSRDYIPGKPGAAMDCGGYNCGCSITDDEGNVITLGGEE